MMATFEHTIIATDSLMCNTDSVEVEEQMKEKINEEEAIVNIWWHKSLFTPL